MKHWYESSIIWKQILQALVTIFGIIKPIAETIAGHPILFNLDGILSPTVITMVSSIIVLIISWFTVKSRVENKNENIITRKRLVA